MRLFVAVNLTDGVRQQVVDAMAPIRVPDSPVRWVAPQLFHVTVKFLGEVSADQLSASQQVMDDVTARFNPFEIGYGGFGVFPNASRPKTISIACEHQATLELIQHEMVVQMAGIGFEPEGRRFNPHLTLGRVRRNTPRRDLDVVLSIMDTLNFETTDYVETLDLMASVRTPGGSSYECLHRSPLGAS